MSSIKIFRLLPRNSTKNKIVVIPTNQLITLIRAILNLKVTSTQVSDIFFHIWMVLYCIRNVSFSVVIEISEGNHLASLCAFWKFILLTKTPSTLQPNGQVERYNSEMVSRPGLYIAENQRNWQIVVQPPPCVYSFQVQRLTDDT